MATKKSKLLKDNWEELSYQPEHMTVGRKRQMEQAKDFMEKLSFTIREIDNKIKRSIPPEQEVAMRLWLYGITCEEFNKMHEHLNIPDPTRIKILNYLQDEYRHRGKRKI